MKTGAGAEVEVKVEVKEELDVETVDRGKKRQRTPTQAFRDRHKEINEKLEAEVARLLAAKQAMEQLLISFKSENEALQADLLQKRDIVARGFAIMYPAQSKELPTSDTIAPTDEFSNPAMDANESSDYNPFSEFFSSM